MWPRAPDCSSRRPTRSMAAASACGGRPSRWPRASVGSPSMDATRASISGSSAWKPTRSPAWRAMPSALSKDPSPGAASPPVVGPRNTFSPTIRPNPTISSSRPRIEVVVNQPVQPEVADRLAGGQGCLARASSAVRVGGCVLGISMTVVTPPKTAERVPVSQSSLCSNPGSRKWTWPSITPARMCMPDASSTLRRFGPATCRGRRALEIGRSRMPMSSGRVVHGTNDGAAAHDQIEGGSSMAGAQPMPPCPAMGIGRAHPILGFYGPDTMMWRINREAVLLGSGPAALLLQIAHPSVGARRGRAQQLRERTRGSGCTARSTDARAGVRRRTGRRAAVRRSSTASCAACAWRGLPRRWTRSCSCGCRRR